MEPIAEKHLARHVGTLWTDATPGGALHLQGWACPGAPATLGNWLDAAQGNPDFHINKETSLQNPPLQQSVLGQRCPHPPRRHIYGTIPCFKRKFLREKEAEILHVV